MLHRRAFLATIAIVSLWLPWPVLGGALYVQGSPCWCNGATIPQAWNTFPVAFAASELGECELVSVAFRIQGVPDDPALMRRFEPLVPGGLTGDPFGEGAIVQGLVPYPGDYPFGYITLYITTPLAPQVWSVEAPHGLAGVTTPVASFESAPGTWVAQAGYSTTIGNVNPQCDGCAQLPAVCPQAVEPGTWSMIKRLYQ
jgi:hypothetical protein